MFTIHALAQENENVYAEKNVNGNSWKFQVGMRIAEIPEILFLLFDARKAMNVFECYTMLAAVKCWRLCVYQMKTNDEMGRFLIAFDLNGGNVRLK